MELSPEQARVMVEAIYKIETYTVYNIYSCGHVIKNNDDPRKIKNRKGFRFRGCHKNGCFGQYITKYKICDCKEKVETIGRLLKESPCPNCVWAKNSKKPMPTVLPGRRDSDKETSAKIKAEMVAIAAAVKRSDCKHRPGCLDDMCKKFMAKTLPCLGCKRYTMGAGGVDSMDATFRNGDAARRMITR